MLNLRKALLLYAVTDRGLLNGKTMENAVEEALLGGVTMIQLREKNLNYDDFLYEAKIIRNLTKKYNVPFIINDNIEIALACGADGVHLGPSDTSIAEARGILGENAVIGATARSPELAVYAWENGASYLGSGAVFGSLTKKDATNMSIDTLSKICSSVPIPVVAIGGINAANISRLKDTGIAGAAVVSSLFGSGNIKAAASELLETMQKTLVL